MTQRDIENIVFLFLNEKYMQRADSRQKAMKLQYMEAETHDLSREMAKLFRTIALAEARNMAERNEPLPEQFYIDTNGQVQFKQ